MKMVLSAMLPSLDMHIKDYSTFDKPRLFSSYETSQSTELQCNFIAFLAAVQRLQVQFLPISWQERRGGLGRGATSRVSQASITLQTSFAFKRVGDEYRQKGVEKVLHCLINELEVLSHPSVQSHPGILDLQGICWEISPIVNSNSSNDAVNPTFSSDKVQVWPVLVFEKSQFGDLLNFSRLPVGQKLTIRERLDICRDIGKAISHMHLHSIIHGDIKPQNILVFRKDDGSWTGRVADFGFSATGERVILPRSWPWYAPECDEYPEFTFPQAVRTEVFSFGMLCLWFVFETAIPEIPPFPEGGQEIGAADVERGPNFSLKLLADLKNRDALQSFAAQLVRWVSEEGDEPFSCLLGRLFGRCLAKDPARRAADIDELLSSIDEPPAVDSAKFSSHDPVAPLRATTGNDASEADGFSISSLLYPFYQSDYRLRRYILRCLEEIVAKDPTGPALSELELCYAIGFGHSELHDQAKPWATGEDQAKLLGRITPRFEPAEVANPSLYNSLADAGQVFTLSLAESYHEENILAQAERATTLEIERAERTLGNAHWIVLQLSFVLSSVLERQGRWQEVEELQKEVIGRSRRALGQDHRFTMGMLGELATTHLNRGRSREAEELQTRLLSMTESTLGQTHGTTMSTMANLATIYIHQGRWNEAEDVQLKVLNLYTGRHGDEHPETLTSMANLALIYSGLGRWQEAEALDGKVINTRRAILGGNHPSTLTSMAYLTLIYSNQSKWQDAEKLQLEVIDASKSTLGEAHPFVLGCQSTLFAIYRNQRRWQDAEILGLEVLKESKTLLGLDHPYVLSNMANLSLLYWDQGRLQEAELLGKDALEKRMRIIGEEHPDTLVSMANLALVYWHQGQLREASMLGEKVVKLRERMLGGKHPATLTSMANLACMWRGLGRGEEARRLLTSTVELHKEVLGPEHPDTIGCISLSDMWGFGI